MATKYVWSGSGLRERREAAEPPEPRSTGGKKPSRGRFVLLFIFALSVAGGSWFAWQFGMISGSDFPPANEAPIAAEPVVPAAAAEVPEIPFHVALPEEVRGIYWTAATAGSARGDELLAFMAGAGLNAAVIDLKMDDGELAFVPNDESLLPYVQDKPAVADLDALLLKLRDAGVYRIARIAVMRDGAFATVHPELAMKNASGAMWRDNIGSLWVDPAATEVSDYAIALGREAYARGFDEVQFDYVRFASDGAVNSIVYPVYDFNETKQAVMQRFFETVGGAMQGDGIPVSFDLFGMTFHSTDDFNIGQRLLDVYPYADFVSPMVYPSHYPATFEGYGNPAEYPYEIVKLALDEGAKMMQLEVDIPEIESRRHFRPWLQDFDIGAVYDAPKIQAQIQATRDAGASGFIFWNARNVYEEGAYDFTN